MGSRKPRGALAEVAGGMINIARNVFFYFPYFFFSFFHSPHMDASTQDELLFVSRRISQSQKFKLPAPNENKFPFNSSLRIVSLLGVYTRWPTFETITILKSFSHSASRLENKKPRDKKNTLINIYTATQGDSPSMRAPFFFNNEVTGIGIFKYNIIYLVTILF